MKGLNKMKDFEKLVLTGKYTQKEIAGQLGISENTASRWVKNMQPLKYYIIRKRMANELERLLKENKYTENAEMISRLITDIERVDGLIRKAKYIPHLTQG
jgi:transposase-like protein